MDIFKTHIKNRASYCLLLTIVLTLIEFTRLRKYSSS